MNRRKLYTVRIRTFVDGQWRNTTVVQRRLSHRSPKRWDMNWRGERVQVQRTETGQFVYDEHLDAGQGGAVDAGDLIHALRKEKAEAQ